MNYIGSKFKLSRFLTSSIDRVAGGAEGKVICDIFAGTGAVGRAFKRDSKKIIANDVEYYSYVLNKNYIGNHIEMDYFGLLTELNYLPGQEGFIFQNYCAGGGTGRQYFSDENGRRIDGIRQKIEQWRKSKDIGEGMYYFLLSSLLEAADAVANTASVYGAFLKHLKKTAQKEMWLYPAEYVINEPEHEVHNRDANELIGEIEGDILYMDPPYNHRQYGANYHMLNTIALYDEFEPSGKTGLRSYVRSRWCIKNQVSTVFDDLVGKAKFKHIFLSYNNEGLMSLDEVRRIMEKYGRYVLIEQPYQRFKADKTENRNHKATSTMEYLHVLEKV
ncbi:MAG: modification methylase [Acidobacteria bacterium ACB1]|nr:Modification methylase FokI [Pyrinomonadaceae bacterium]MCE7961391.1 modification methylase [Acidobacteria bacterium ACB1]RIJ94771.1 MAG: modification methylase [Acidobacteriota bacterium]